MIVVVDTGGTKTLVASFNNRGLLLKSTKFPTPKDTSEYIKALKNVQFINTLKRTVENLGCFKQTRNIFIPKT